MPRSGCARGLTRGALARGGAVPVALGQELEGEELAVALLPAAGLGRAEQGAAVPAVLQRAQLQLRVADPAHVAGAGGCRGQSPLAAAQEAAAVFQGIPPGVLQGAVVPGSVAVGPPAQLLAPVALAPQDLDKSPLELFAGAGVDNGIQAAVEVAKPKNHLEDRFRGLQG